MKKVFLSAVAALALTAAAPALAADMPMKAKPLVPAAATSPWDVLFGTAFTTDYELRGVSQSAPQACGAGLFRSRLHRHRLAEALCRRLGLEPVTQVSPTANSISAAARGLVGAISASISASSTMIIRTATGRTASTAAIGEFYAKPSYKLARLADRRRHHSKRLQQLEQQMLFAGCVGVWTGDADAGLLLSAMLSSRLPWHPITDVTLSINPEIGRRMVQLERELQYGRPLGFASYTYWDVGLDINYKAITLDLRYWDTDAKPGTTNAICAVNGHPGMNALRLPLCCHSQVRHLAVGS